MTDKLHCVVSVCKQLTKTTAGFWRALLLKKQLKFRLIVFDKNSQGTIVTISI